MNNRIIRLAIKKARQSSCRYKISALGFNRKGDFIGSAINAKRLPKHGCSLHAEIALIRKYGKRLSVIIICRTNKTGTSNLPIHPCPTCSSMANRYSITIKTVR